MVSTKQEPFLARRQVRTARRQKITKLQAKNLFWLCHAGGVFAPNVPEEDQERSDAEEDEGEGEEDDDADLLADEPSDSIDGFTPRKK